VECPSSITERGLEHTSLMTSNSDGRVYAFTQIGGFDPHVIVSEDDGQSWDYAGKLTAPELTLFVGPEMSYVSDGERDFAERRRRQLLLESVAIRNVHRQVSLSVRSGAGLIARRPGAASKSGPGNALERRATAGSPAPCVTPTGHSRRTGSA